jgi:DNA-binding CsgD family transcriptional regulator
MTEEAPVPAGRTLWAPAILSPSVGRGLVRSGAEIVGLSERFYGGIFLALVVFVGLASLAALVLLPLRQPAASGGPPIAGVVGAALLIIAAPVAVRRAGALYRALRRSTALQLGVVLYAAALVAVVLPLKSQLWWPSCTLLMLLAIVSSLPRVLVYCLVVLGANLFAHLAVGDLHRTSPVTIIGLWIGYVLWSATVAGVTDQLAAHLLRLNATSSASPIAARRVVAWEPELAADPAPAEAGELTSSAQGDPGAAQSEGSTTVMRAGVPPTASPASNSPARARLDRLTARQLQVVALLADGLRYREVAACLSISEGQVQRHVARAVERLGVRSAAELVTTAVAEGMVPRRDPSDAGKESRLETSAVGASEREVDQ